MRRFVPLALIACVWAGAAHAVEGTWTAKPDAKRPDQLYLALKYGRVNNMDMSHDLSRFTGLDARATRSVTSTPVSFALDREAGRLDFEGTFENGRGSGRFTFRPNSGYFDKIRALGVDVSGRKNWGPSRNEDEQLLFLTLIDVSTDYIRSMIAEGYRVSFDDYQSMRLFNVTPEHIQEMRALGFEDISASEIVATRIHGITPEYVREMRAAGWDLSLNQYQSARIFDVTPEYREEMAKIGYRLSLDKLTAFRIHNVTPEWIAELKELGYDGLSADDLVSTRIFHVTPQFIRSVEDAGYKGLSMRELISMKVQGMTAQDLTKRRAI